MYDCPSEVKRANYVGCCVKKPIGWIGQPVGGMGSWVPRAIGTIGEERLHCRLGVHATEIHLGTKPGGAPNMYGRPMGVQSWVRLARAQIKFIRVNSKAVLQYDSATVRRLRTDIDVARACEVHQGAGRCTKL